MVPILFKVKNPSITCTHIAKPSVPCICSSISAESANDGSWVLSQSLLKRFYIRRTLAVPTHVVQLHSTAMWCYHLNTDIEHSPSQQVLLVSTVLEGEPHQNKERERHGGPENRKSAYRKEVQGTHRIRIKTEAQTAAGGWQAPSRLQWETGFQGHLFRENPWRDYLTFCTSGDDTARED